VAVLEAALFQGFDVAMPQGKGGEETSVDLVARIGVRRDGIAFLVLGAIGE
jgi:hypothetical protein